ncbi:MAG: hypothetical protein J7K09_05410 [Desulfuromusa sp.]|nr:hypothetical protein [Desulfuromusa sp.]
MKALSSHFSLLALLLAFFSYDNSAFADSFDIITDAELIVDLRNEAGLKKDQKIPGTTLEKLQQLLAPQISIRLGQHSVSSFREWQAVQVSTEIIHFKRHEWPDHFFELNLPAASLSFVGYGVFGKGGGFKMPLGLKNLKKNNAGNYVLQVQPVVLSFDLDRDKVSLTLESQPLADSQNFSATRIDNHRVQIKHNSWGDFFWEADSNKRQVWLQSGSLGSSIGERTLIDGALPLLMTHTRTYPGKKTSPDQTVVQRPEKEDIDKNLSDWPVDKTLAMEINKHRKPSDWQEKKKNIYREIIVGLSYDTLLVPVQVDGYAIDRAGRSLMTQFIYQRLKDAGRSLPNPTLTARALGEKNRTFKEDTINSLAQEIKASSIIVPAIGHNGQGKLSISLLHLSADATGSFNGLGVSLKQAKEKSLPFSDEQLPFEILLSHLDNLLHQINIDLPIKKKNRINMQTVTPGLPDSPLELFKKKSLSSLENGYYLQLFGILHPKQTVASEGLFERSLVAAWKLPRSHPDRSLLIARALFHLHRRPAAIKFLGTPQTIEEKAFLAFLNGNLAVLDELRKQIKQPLKKLFADIEYQDLFWAYTQNPLEDTIIEEMVGDRQEWSSLIVRRLLNRWIWRSQSNIMIKDMLDKAFPIEGFTAQALVTSQIALGKSPYEGTEIQLAAYEHCYQILESQGSQLFAEVEGLGLHKSDYLDLLYETSEANLIDSVAKSVWLQHLADRGLEKLRNYSTIYEGHPALTYWKSQALEIKAEESRGRKKEQISKEVEKLKDLCAFWNQGQGYPVHLDIFKHDFPKRYFWVSKVSPLHSLENSLRYTNGNFAVATRLYKYYKLPGREKQLEDFLIILKDRFVGDPERQDLFAKISEDKGEFDKAEQFHREAIEIFPNEWVSYQKLGELFIRQSRLEEAYEILINFPPFTDENPTRTVALSNHAMKAAKLFYKLGLTEKATAFFQIAQSFHTGSAAEMYSAAISDLAEKNYQPMAEHFLRGIQRYQNNFFYSEYIKYLHVFQQHQAAWAIFDNLAPDKLSSVTWESALYGLRTEGKSEQEIDNWFSTQADKPEAVEFVLHQLIDRDRRPDTSQLSAKAGSVKKKFIDIYSSYKTGNFKQLHHFHKVDNIRQLRTDLLPYLAVHYHYFDRHEEFKQLLQKSTDVHGKGFYSYLTEGVIAGLESSNPQLALGLFRKAWLNIHLLKNQFLPPLYQLSDICEWLFERTGKQSYLNASLDYADLQYKQDPLASWPYSIRAKYAKTELERLSALGAALYLDKNSARISHFNGEERKQAEQLFEKNNIFTEPQEELLKTQI